MKILSINNISEFVLNYYVTNNKTIVRLDSLFFDLLIKYKYEEESIKWRPYNGSRPAILFFKHLEKTNMLYSFYKDLSNLINLNENNRSK